MTALDSMSFVMDPWTDSFSRGSKYPILKDSGPKTNRGMVFGTRDLKFENLGYLDPLGSTP